jgi:hypothetical protein
VPVVLVASSLMALSGCATSTFERDWKTAASYANAADDISGCWEGTWESHVNGHHGKLRAIVTRQGADTYYMQFKATFLGVVPFKFALPVYVTENGGVYALQGEADLGWLAGGVYTYSGEATPCDFVSSYCAKNDHGVFRMTRKVSCIQCSDNSEYRDLVEFADFVHGTEEESRTANER